MALKDVLMKDMKEAMRNKDTVRKGVITMLRNGLAIIEKEEKRELTREDELAVLGRELKQNQDSLLEAQKANRQDIVEQVNAKIAVIKEYLPKEMNEAEVMEVMDKLPINRSMKMGELIAIVHKEVDGAADKRMISKVVKEYLEQNK